MSKLSTHLKGHASTATAAENRTWNKGDAGPFVGIVKDNKDPARMGRLKVHIPPLDLANSPTKDQLYTCEYLTPFYGAKDIRYNSSTGTDYEGSQHSYGFWGVPPDIGTRVLVIFAEGKREEAFWIGCIQEPYTNHMVPGIAASDKTWDVKNTPSNPNQREGAAGARTDKQKTYGTTTVPAGELNRAQPGANPTVDYDAYSKPIHPLADLLANQGLSADPIRGTTTSSARRESPSQVFGMSTPGRKDQAFSKVPVGTADSKATDYVVRGIGHTFVMDDGDQAGDNQLTRLRTASGHQVLMHDTEGVVYIANGSGNSWIEMSPEGKIYIYAQDGFNFRSDGDFDLHSGGNITFHSANDIRFTAEGSVVNNAETYLMNMGKKGIFTSSQEGFISDYAKNGVTASTDGQILIGSQGGPIHLSGPQVHFNSVRAQPAWGPSWLTPDAVGIVTDESQNDVNITVGAGELLEANTASTKTTVSNLVTHEPFTRAPSAIIEGVSQWQNASEWERLSQTPGTLEYMAQQNRKSTNKHVRTLQFFQDQKKFVSEQNTKSAFKSLELLDTNKTQLLAIDKKLKSKQSLTSGDAKLLQDLNLYNPREAKITGATVLENVNANTSVIASRVSRAFLDYQRQGEVELAKMKKFMNSSKHVSNLDKAKSLSDEFTSKYNTIYNVSSVVKNLSKDNLKTILINKVTAGKLTSVNIPKLNISTSANIVKNAFKFSTRSSANNVPPSMRSTFTGRITQAANTIGGGLKRAFSSFFRN